MFACYLGLAVNCLLIPVPPLFLRVYTVTLSMMEIYCEQLNDLLDGNKYNLEVQEAPVKNGSTLTTMLVKGLSEIKVANADAAMALFRKGQEIRKVRKV